jgi:1-deoxy-D-xylulose-5-phosphate reductoisomerase
MKRVAILGSTGSVGTQALDVIASNKRRLEAVLLTCNSRIDKLRRQIEKFSPIAVAVGNEEDALELRREYPHLKIYFGTEGLKEIIEETDSDGVLNAIVGVAGLEPTIAAINKGGLTIALANKETLVTGGRLVMGAANDAGVRIVPVDSEHSAIFQCVAGNEGNEIRRIVLTASGGPFRGYSRIQLKSVSVSDALIHPNWKMGRKITIDSATMINKALEVIEAKWLYDIEAGRIEVAIHPQSIIHSIVEYEDGAFMAQLSTPNMRLPISYAFSWPERWVTNTHSLDLIGLRALNFEEPSREARRALDLAYRVLRESETSGKDSGAIMLNGANEALVQMFLDGQIPFAGIVDTLERVLDSHEATTVDSIDDVLCIDREARQAVLDCLCKSR